MVIRRANLDDAEAIARVHCASWRSTYAGLMPAPFIERRTQLGPRIAQAQAALARTGASVFVAEAEDGVCGFANWGAMPERPQDREPLPGYDAYLYGLYLLAQVQGRGLGRAMLQAVAGALLLDGRSSMALHVLAVNPARGFYERLGARHVRDEPPDEIPEGRIYVCAYGWPDVRCLESRVGE